MIRLFDPEAPVDPPRLPGGAPAAPHGDPSDQSHYRLDFTRSLRMLCRLALGFTLVGLILSVLYMVSFGSIGRVSIGPASIGRVSIGTVSMYTAQSLVYIQRPPHWPNNDDPAAYDFYIQQQMLSMTRPDVLAGALKMLAPGVWQRSGESDDRAADRLRGAVQVARVRTSYLVAITAHANNPGTAAAVANAVAASYIENNARVSAPGAAHLAEAAVPPSHPAIAGVVRNALLLLFAFILLGLGAEAVAHKMDQHAVAQSRGIVPEATPAVPVREISALVETAATAAVTATPAAPPARQVTQESATPERTAPVRATIAPKPLPQSASVVAENREARSLPQRAPVTPAIPRNIAPAPLRLAGSPSQPGRRPLKPAMPGPAIDDPRSQPVRRAVTLPAQQLHDENLEWLQEEPPWWFTDAPPPTDSALTQPRKPLLGAWHSIPAQDGRKPAVAQVREKVKAGDEMSTRLSELRGLHFSLGVKELNQKNDAGRHDAGNRNGAGNRARADVALVDREQAMVAETLAPQPEYEPAKAKEEETIARPATSRWATAEPESLSWSAEETNKGKESRWNRGNDDTGARDDIQILPSKRGQYKR